MNPNQILEASRPVNAHAHLGTILNPRLNQWFAPDAKVHATVAPHDLAREIVAVYDDALARLKGKRGARAEAARAQIEAARAPLADGLALVNELGAQLDGPLALGFQKRIATTRANLAAALAAKELATRATIDAALLEVERCLADVRELERDIAAVYDKLSPRLRVWPDLAELQGAEPSTRQLESQKAVTASAVRDAIEQGMKAPAHVAALWAAFEAVPDHELTAWRARAYAERLT